MKKVLQRYHLQRHIQNMRSHLPIQLTLKYLMGKDTQWIIVANSEVSNGEGYPMDHPRIIFHQLSEPPSSAKASTSTDSPKITSKSTPTANKKKGASGTKNNTDKNLTSQSSSKTIVRKNHNKDFSKFSRICPNYSRNYSSQTVFCVTQEI